MDMITCNMSIQQQLLGYAGRAVEQVCEHLGYDTSEQGGYFRASALTNKHELVSICSGLVGSVCLSEARTFEHFSKEKMVRLTEMHKKYEHFSSAQSANVSKELYPGAILIPRAILCEGSLGTIFSFSGMKAHEDEVVDMLIAKNMGYLDAIIAAELINLSDNQVAMDMV